MSNSNRSGAARHVRALSDEYASAPTVVHHSDPERTEAFHLCSLGAPVRAAVPSRQSAPRAQAPRPTSAYTSFASSEALAASPRRSSADVVLWIALISLVAGCAALFGVALLV